MPLPIINTRKVGEVWIPESLDAPTTHAPEEPIIPTDEPPPEDPLTAEEIKSISDTLDEADGWGSGVCDWDALMGIC